MFLVYDTETTGFPSPSLPSNHPNQGRVCQFACLKLDKDLNEVGGISTLIKPDGWTYITEGAYKQNGHTMERCEKEGRPMGEVLLELNSLVCDCSTIIAHKVIFDRQMMAIECDYHKWGILLDNIPTHICTMELTTPICKLPQKRRNAFGQQYKWPKLQEAYFHFFGKTFDKAHDALADVRATARIFKHLVEKGYYKLDNKQQTITTQETTIV